MIEVISRSLFLCVSLAGILVVAVLTFAHPALAQNPPGGAGAKPVLSGKVTDQAGKAIANATVQLVGASFQETKTDAQGDYAFSSIKTAGPHFLGVEALGFVPIELAKSIQPIELTPGSQIKRDLVLERGASIVVTVTDSAGKAIKNARVNADPLVRYNRGSDYRSLQTDDAGMAVVTVATLQKQYMITVMGDGFAPARVPATVESVEKPVDVAVALEPGQSVQGVAMCNDGKPAAGWEIYATPDWWVSDIPPAAAKIDAQGNFVLKDLGPGPHKLKVVVRIGLSGRTIELPSFSVPLAQQPMKVEIATASPASRVKVTGKVRATGGRPETLSVNMSGASGIGDFHFGQVDFGPPAANADKNGVFEGTYSMDGVAPGTYRLYFTSPMTETKTLEGVKIPGEIPLVEIKVGDKPHLSGTAIDAATGAAIPEFLIRIRGDNSMYSLAALGGRWTQIKSAEGKFDEELVSPGTYKVQVMADGYAAAWSKDIRVAGAEAKADVQVKLTAGGTLSGVVVDPSGKPVVGAMVSPFSVAGKIPWMEVQPFQSDVRAVKTDSAGRFTLVHLASGDEKLRISHADFARQTVPSAKVSEGQTTDIGTVRLASGGSVRGVVYDVNGKPDAGVPLAFADNDGWSGGEDDAVGHMLAQVSTDDEGKFQVQHLPEVATYVMAMDQLNRQGVSRRVIRPINGKTIQVDFGGVEAVTGRVIGENGPVANAWLGFGGPSPYGRMTVGGMTDSAGRFTLYGPPPGKYSLYYAIDKQQRKRTWVKDVVFTGKAADLGDLKAEGTDLLITVTSDEPAALAGVQSVSASPADDGGRRIDAQRDEATGQWRAKGLPAGKYRVATSVGQVAFATVAECDGTAGERPVRLHLPKASATLSVNVVKAVESASGVMQGTALTNDDKSVMAGLTTEPQQQEALKLPPGTYHVLDDTWVKVREDIPAITLSDGETKTVEIVLPPPKVEKIIAVNVWTADGILASDVPVQVLDSDGKSAGKPMQWRAGNVYALGPGRYRAVVDRAGAQPLTKEFEVTAGADYVINVDLPLR